MLNLTRFPTESIQIGDGITVTVLGVNGNQVRLGINAPKDVVVLREEVFDRMDTPSAKKTVPQAAHQRPILSPQPNPASSPKEPKVRYKRRVRIPVHDKA